MVATVATLDPVTAANIPEPASEASAGPPGSRRNAEVARSNAALASPARTAKTPITMNSGMIVSE